MNSNMNLLIIKAAMLVHQIHIALIHLVIVSYYSNILAWDCLKLSYNVQCAANLRLQY